MAKQGNESHFVLVVGLITVDERDSLLMDELAESAGSIGDVVKAEMLSNLQSVHYVRRARLCVLREDRVDA